MSFKATVYIQGAGNYVRHSNKDELAVLFPDTHTLAGKKLRDINADEIGNHFAVIQTNIPAFGGPTPGWTTVFLDKQWVSFEGVGDGVESYRIDGRGLGLWEAEEVLEEDDLEDFLPFNRDALPGGGGAEELLVAGVIVAQGVLGADGDRQGPMTLYSGNRQPVSEERQTTAAVKVDVGNVETLHLLVRSMTGGDEQRIELRPPGGEDLELWIRHFCDIRPPREPDPNQPGPDVDTPDLDFPINFLLRERFDRLIRHRGHRLPHPVVTGSWAGGGGIGSDPSICGGKEEARMAFDNPFEADR